MKKVLITILILSGILVGCATTAINDGGAQLTREAYISRVDNLERDFFVYLPVGYHPGSSPKWPVLIFLHGDGERGDGKEDLDYILKSGPLYEAWIQKRDLPFIIIAPQLHMFERGGPEGPDYILNRKRADIPQRLIKGTPPHNQDAPAMQMAGPMVGQVAAGEVGIDEVVEKNGWHKTDPDVITILDFVLSKFNADANRVYLTGLSMGGFGTWFYAAEYPERFAAILPIVGYPTVEQAEAVARSGIPAWCFSGGRDPVVPTKYFFLGMNKIEEAQGVMRFTTEQDMWHDVWNRVYTGEDVYHWLLQHKKK